MMAHSIITKVAHFATLLCVVAIPTSSASAAPTPLKANWIWTAKGVFDNPYNQTIVARRTFKVKAIAAAEVKITADTWYRLKINGQWVNDGPCRSWPEHFQYDVLDVAPYLKTGENQIEIVARYFGAGDFHHVAKEPGLLAQLDMTTSDGETVTIVTDASWEAAPARAWVQNVPKVSIQMEPGEWYDARVEGLKFQKAAVIHAADAGPWRNLSPRDVALLTRQPFALKSFVKAQVVRSPGVSFTLASAQLLHPGAIEANHNVNVGCGMATVLTLDKPGMVALDGDNMKFAINGKRSKNGQFQLEAGRHLLLAFVSPPVSHKKEQRIRFLNLEQPSLNNPLDAQDANPWCFLRFPEINFATNDIMWIGFHQENKFVLERTEAYSKLTDRLMTEVATETDFKSKLSKDAELISASRMFVHDSVPQTWNREVVADATANVRNPWALMHDTPEATEVLPDSRGDIEMLYDLGEQNCGYWSFDLTAEEGVIVDIVGVEFIAPDGQIQWSLDNRNGLRYITRAGNNKFLSVKRRSGRYLFVTLRNLRSPARIRNLQLIESTYPVNAVGSFSCSDPRLDRIWEISRRTLKLCMEDTYTDCPLYEQTHWVGDARNESLYGYNVFGAYNLGTHCARQTAQSLERFPIAGCQVPSAWECLLPAWSFLWTVSTWDAYWASGDLGFLKEMHPFVIRNLEGAAGFLDERDLFSGPFWNMFDWTPIDQNQRAVLHNSMLLVGAIDAALESEKALGCEQHEARLRALRDRLATALNKLWDTSKESYPDSIRSDGSISPSTSQHTSFLSALYDIAPREHTPALTRNILQPPKGMVRVGSPFAGQYQFEALEKLGLDNEIISLIYTNYVPMLDAGATTVWESFPSGTTGRDGFPTRSHCHAWSSAPLYFLNRIVLGLRSAEPGWKSATLSPKPGGLNWARGNTVTPFGPVWVEWKLADNLLEIFCKAPGEVSVKFQTNETLKGIKVLLNGKAAQE